MGKKTAAHPAGLHFRAAVAAALVFIRVELPMITYFRPLFLKSSSVVKCPIRAVSGLPCKSNSCVQTFAVV
jgi:hypothetical protein